MQPQFVFYSSSLVKAPKMKIDVKTFSTAESETVVAEMLQNRCS